MDESVGAAANKPKERWLPVPEDPNVLISDRGRVKRGGKIKKLGKDRDGYARITIKGKTIRLHRLVAQLYVPNPDNKPVVDHIDNNRDNLNWTNLRWVTVKENSQYAADMGLMSRIQSSDSVVIAIDKDNNGFLFKTVSEACRYIGIDDSVGHLLIQGKRKTAKGYRMLRVDSLTQISEHVVIKKKGSKKK